MSDYPPVVISTTTVKSIIPRRVIWRLRVKRRIETARTNWRWRRMGLNREQRDRIWQLCRDMERAYDHAVINGKGKQL